MEEEKENIKESEINQNGLIQNINYEEKELIPSQKDMIISYVNERILCKCSKLLIVDDDSGIRAVIQAFARSVMVISDEARNGLEAVEQVKEKLNNNCCKFYRLILIDYHMPIMDGIEASLNIAELLDNYSDSNTRVILILGLSEEEKKKINSLKRMPFTLIESKPLKKERLEQLIIQNLF